MTRQTRGPRVHERWAHLRFSVIGQLLAAPPAKGELKAAIEGLAGRTWQHPTTGEPVCFGFSTIEHWYYRALKERTDPVGVLRRKVRVNAGRQHAISDAVRQAVLAQYAAHKSWSVQLHHDNLVALAETEPELKPVPSYPTLRRFMKTNGLDKRRRVTSRQTDGADRAEDKLADGTWLEDSLGSLHEELEERGIRARPHAWISSEWFSPENTPGIAIPFYLTHRRLMQLERKMIIDVEGGTWSECMRILRHESGHVLQHSYQLQRRRRWQKLLGRSSQRYPRYYRPNPASRHFVQHLRLWYAQSHPDEDFAETFAVWLRPRSNHEGGDGGW